MNEEEFKMRYQGKWPNNHSSEEELIDLIKVLMFKAWHRDQMPTKEAEDLIKQQIGNIVMLCKGIELERGAVNGYK